MAEDQAWEEAGFWWLPGTPDDQVAGILRFEPHQQITLSLIGSFGGMEALASTTARHPVIHGIAKGRTFTVLGAIQVGTHLAIPGFVSETYLSSVVIESALLEEHALVFDEVELELTHLAAWVTRYGFTAEIERGDGGSLKEYRMRYSPPDEYVAPSTAIGEVKITSGFTAPGMVSHQHTSVETPYLRIRLDRLRSMDEVFKGVVTPLANLLTLAVDQRNEVTRFSVRSPHQEATVSGVRQSLPVHFIPGLPAPAVASTPRPHDMLLHLTDLDTIGFDSAIRQWLTIATDLEHVCELFFGTRQVPLPGELRFLNLVRAAEVYHRRNHNATAEPEAVHKARLKRLKDTAPEEDRKWLAGALQWSNEISLKACMDDLLGFVGPAIRPALPKNFVRMVVDTRNYLTHYGASKRGVTDPGDLYQLSEVVALLVQLCLLREIGFTAEQCTELLGRNARFRFIATNSQKF